MTIAAGNIPPFFSPGFWPGGTVPNATTFNAAVTMKETLTINKTAEAATAETILSTKVSDDATAKLDIINTDGSANYYLPGILSVTKDTQRALTLIGQGTTDTGSNPLIALRGRIGASTTVSTRPIVQIQKADGTPLLDGLPLNSGANLALSWGTQTGANPAFTTRSAGTRIILYSAISGSSVDTAIGTGASGATATYSVQQASASHAHEWYGGTTRIAALRGDGKFVTTGARVDKLRVATTTPVTVNSGTDYIVVTNLGTPGAVAVNLPASPDTGMTFVIKDGKGDAGSNNITITPAAGNIDGAGTLVLSTNYARCVLTYNGTEWNRID